MDKHLERFARKLAQDAVKRTGESLLEMFGEQNPWFKPAFEELQNGNRRYPQKKSKKRQTEKVVCDRLAATISSSKTEVVTDSGRIDILTPNEVIEVKQVRRYKHAMGQVISYGYYYPRRTKRIHLYGQVSSKQRKLIIRECQASQIRVTFES
ncbi:MAG: hypothetical protein AAFO85_08555 [Cyanobacteria bacterium J06598_4]